MGGTIHVIGVGNEGRESLTPRALALIRQAEVLAGGQRLLGFFPEVRAERVRIGAKVDEVLAGLAARLGEKRIVILATGDPNFFGITRALLRHVLRESLEILPNVSALQWAFAKARETWDDAAFLSVHGRTMERLPELVRGKSKLCLFTDETNSPAAIAQTLLRAGLDGYRALLCEDLGGPQERVTETTLEVLAGTEAHPLNTLILLATGEARAPEPPWAPGLPDDAFDQRKPKVGLITKREIRILSLARLAIRPDGVVWDIGAGSGSVSIEAAKLASLGRVFAVEKNAEDVEIIRGNVARFRVPHVAAVHAKAPDGLEALPNPDAVFVGGSGGAMREILEIAAARLRPAGRIVVNAITLDSLHEAVTAMRDLGLAHEAILVSIARSKPLLGMMSFEALNPVYVVTAWHETPPPGRGRPA
jgi:precorrin-6Y C5,15-methyltransferase (decarboxylating)